MPGDTEVTIYYGPLSWFRDQFQAEDRDEYLLDVVAAHDEARRSIIHKVEGQSTLDDEDQRPRPKRIVAESTDYASVSEHAITNFIGLTRSLDPEKLLLHNPPAHIHTQMEREFRPKVVRYEYPTVTQDTLRQFQDGFGEHLVGQSAVKEAVLAALYTLTTGRRTTPVVLMFYGPSGVGKTETAQFVNGLLGGRLMRKQFSMLRTTITTSHSTSPLLWPPSGGADRGRRCLSQGCPCCRHEANTDRSADC